MSATLAGAVTSAHIVVPATVEAASTTSPPTVVIASLRFICRRALMRPYESTARRERGFRRTPADTRRMAAEAREVRDEKSELRTSNFDSLLE